MLVLPDHVRHLLSELDEAKEWIEVHGHQQEIRDMFLDIRRITYWLTGDNAGTNEEISLRILKIGEELGEAIQAWIGVTGQNPRKGVTHKREDVVTELMDVAITAFVAVQCMGYPSESMFDKRLAEIVARMET